MASLNGQVTRFDLPKNEMSSLRPVALEGNSQPESRNLQKELKENIL